MKKGSATAKKSDIKKAHKMVEDKTFGMKNKNSKKNQKVIQNMTNSVAGNMRQKQQQQSNQQLTKKQLKAQRDEEMKVLGLGREYEKKPQMSENSTNSANPNIQNVAPPKILSLEEQIELDRSRLGPNLTPVTLESFNAWKANRRASQAEADLKKPARVVMTGRELFNKQNSMFVDDERAAEHDVYAVNLEEELAAGLEEQARMDSEFRGEVFDAEKFYKESAAYFKHLKNIKSPALLSPDSHDVKIAEAQLEALHIEDETLFQE